ncbi:hypothetical protein H5410_056235 [Solanum commersonii]|uniref:Uncharacterized protein n=1 Tax=Solanum commersonii TaxID=4109 RepID=A0A9J5WL41_SOLCO|nr:hypothetical protein H5410_056235 [Solanum commersonii]
MLLKYNILQVIFVICRELNKSTCPLPIISNRSFGVVAFFHSSNSIISFLLRPQGFSLRKGECTRQKSSGGGESIPKKDTKIWTRNRA